MSSQSITTELYSVSLSRIERMVIETFLSEFIKQEKDDQEDPETAAEAIALITAIQELFRQTMDYSGVADSAVSAVKISYMMTAEQLECLSTIADAIEEETMKHIFSGGPSGLVALTVTNVFAALNLQIHEAYPHLFEL